MNFREPVLEIIAFGGGCHWCTEAVFQSIKGVYHVDQGFVSSQGNAIEFSEGVIVHFDPGITGLNTLIRIHLNTHSSTSNHAMRKKYRSAIYTTSNKQEKEVNKILIDLKQEYSEELIINVLPFRKFEPSDDSFRNYYKKDPGRPFCRKYIEPKLELLRKDFSAHLKK